MDSIILKQSEMCAIFEQHNRSYLTTLRKDIVTLKNHLTQLKKLQEVDNIVIDREEKLLNFYERELLSVERVVSRCGNMIGLNRVYLNHGGVDMDKFGVFDGWPGTYWITKQTGY